MGYVIGAMIVANLGIAAFIAVIGAIETIGK